MGQTAIIRALAMSSIILAGIATSGCELAVGSWNAEARETWTRSYTLGKDGRFELANHNGSIIVEPSTDGQVHVRAEKIAKGATDEAAREGLKRIEITERVEASLVRLETATKRGEGGLFGGTNAQVQYSVKVPPTVFVKVDNTNGRVQLVDLEGQVEAETTNGGMEGRGLRGAVKASTTNGGIEVDLASVAEGGVELETTNGGITLKLPANAKADISAQTTNGGISDEGLNLEKSQSTRRRLEARLNGGGPRVHAETTNGGITLSGRQGTH